MDNKRKGQEILIRAIKKVLEQNYQVELILVGDGEIKPQFEKLAKDLGISDHVFFKGAITEKSNIIKLLADSHMFVFPSLSEGLPRVLLEAMATSTPCIASDVDGIPELLNEDCIVYDGEPDTYADKIMGFLDSWERMMEASKENYAVAKKYNKEVGEISYLFCDDEKIASLVSDYSPVVIVENECVVVTGNKLLQAFDYLEVAEFSAKSLVMSTALGEMIPISDDEVEELGKVMGRWRNYNWKM